MFAAGKATTPVSTPVYVEDVFSTYLYQGTSATQKITNNILLADSSVVASESSTALPTTTNLNYQSVAGSNSIAVAFGYIAASGAWTTTYYATTADGITWTNRTMPQTSPWTQVAYGGGNFVVASFAVTSYSIISRSYYSSDGINWSASSGFPTDFTPQKTRYINSQFFVVGADDANNPYLYKAATGTSWSASTPPSTGGVNLTDIAYGLGYYVVIDGTNAYYSSNLSTWSSATSLGSTNTVYSLCFGGGVFVAGTSAGIQRSTSGTSWSLVSSSPTYVFDITYDGTKFIGCTSGGKIVTSTDGSTWTTYSTASDSVNRLTTLGSSTVFIKTGTGVRYGGVINSFTPANIGKGGLVWVKARVATTGGAAQHRLIDTARGISGGVLSTNSNGGSANVGTDFTSFNSDGFTLGAINQTYWWNESEKIYTSWTFRKQPKFFDIVTYTGNGSDQTLTHNLQSTPGCIMVKALSGSQNWIVWHNNFTSGQNLQLDTTGGGPYANSYFATLPTSSQFTVSGGGYVNSNGVAYVAYIFAHNAGGFGLTGADNIISCGSYTGTGSYPLEVTLGYEPQWLLVKRASSGTCDWYILDTMRGMVASGGGSIDKELYANLSDAEATSLSFGPTATGFTVKNTGAINNSGSTYIYVAIRRPNKVPTTGLSVLDIAETSSGTINFNSSGFDNNSNSSKAADLILGRTKRNTTSYTAAVDRLRGISPTSNSSKRLLTNTTDTETSGGEGSDANIYWQSATNNNIIVNSGTGPVIAYAFHRAPGFFEEVCWTGSGAAKNITHNLGVAPELVINKNRTGTANDWCIWPGPAISGNNNTLFLNSTQAIYAGINYWGSSYSSSMTSTTFSVGSSTATNESGSTYVSYLFATLAGVSKVGSFTKVSGSDISVNCGFTAGARFILLKGTDATSASSWLLLDTARGYSTSNDPFLRINAATAEQTADLLDTYSAGFTVKDGGVNNGAYIFLAIA